MSRHVLFIHGGGEALTTKTRCWRRRLRNALGPAYDVRYPRMVDEASPEYPAWKAQIASELASLDGEVVLVGHSLGASILLKHLSEEPVEGRIAAVVLLATPYRGADQGHLSCYAAKFPDATIREVGGRGHQFGNDLTDVAEDIARLDGAG